MIKSHKAVMIPDGTRSTLWPFPDGTGWWKVVTGLLFFPVAAVLHHLVFFRNMCMLNTIGADYYPAVISNWLSRDPSPWVALVVAAGVYLAGRRMRIVRTLVAPLVVATIPLSLWLWDIPLSGRAICNAFHDGRLVLFSSYHVTSRSFYLLSLCLYVALLSFRPTSAHASRS